LASAAVSVRDRHQFPLLIAHTDWSARNIRIRDDQIVASYDWDSLALVS
jgi:hypothetical protein